MPLVPKVHEFVVCWAWLQTEWAWSFEKVLHVDWSTSGIDYGKYCSCCNSVVSQVWKYDIIFVWVEELKHGSWHLVYILTGSCRGPLKGIMGLFPESGAKIWLSTARPSLKTYWASKWALCPHKGAHIWIQSNRRAGQIAQVLSFFLNHHCILLFFSLLWPWCSEASTLKSLRSWNAWVLADCNRSWRLPQGSQYLWIPVWVTPFVHVSVLATIALLNAFELNSRCFLYFLTGSSFFLSGNFTSLHSMRFWWWAITGFVECVPRFQTSDSIGWKFLLLQQQSSGTHWRNFQKKKSPLLVCSLRI